MALGQGIYLPELKKLYEVYRILVKRAVYVTKAQHLQPRVSLPKSMRLAYEEGFLSDFFFSFVHCLLVWRPLD